VSPAAAAYLLGTLGLAVGLFIARRWCRRPRVRVSLALGTLFLLLHLAYLFFVPVLPGIFTFLIPYTPIGAWATTDVEGTRCTVSVQAKARCCSTPPGEHPRVRLEASGVHGRAVYIIDTDWRFGPGTITPIPGGLEIYQTFPEGWGVRFLLHRDHWIEETILPRDWQ
jgi:hypothetical protein